MKRYRVHVILDEVYDDIVAENEEEAFIFASDAAMEGGCWQRKVEELGEVEDEEEDEEDIEGD